jgi:hypothetical protein
VDKVGLSLLVATPIAHAFWADTNPSARAEDINNFSKNVGLLRGAMMVAYRFPIPQLEAKVLRLSYVKCATSR